MRAGGNASSAKSWASSVCADGGKPAIAASMCVNVSAVAALRSPTAVGSALASSTGRIAVMIASPSVSSARRATAVARECGRCNQRAATSAVVPARPAAINVRREIIGKSLVKPCNENAAASRLRCSRENIPPTVG